VTLPPRGPQATRLIPVAFLLSAVAGHLPTPAHAADLVVDSILFNATTNVEAEGDQPPGLATGFSVSSAQGGTDDPEDAFGNEDGDVEPSTFIFGDGGIADDGDQTLEPGVETVDFIQWETTSPVAIAGYRVALTQADPFGRGTQLVRFLVDGVERDLFDHDAVTSPDVRDRPFGATVTGSTFRLEVTRDSNGPRIWEVDALVEGTAASQINVNLAGGGAFPMAPAETAGAPGVNDDNWVNLSGTTLVAGPTQVLGGDGLPVPGALASWQGFGQGGLDDGNGTDDTHMLSSLFDAYEYPAVALTVTGVPYDSYDVYAYHQGGAPPGLVRVARFTIGETDLYSLRRTDDAYVESTSTSDLGAATEPGSYVVFRGLSDPSFTLTVGGTTANDGFRRARFAGVQIVQATTTTTTISTTTTTTVVASSSTTTATPSTSTPTPSSTTSSTTAAPTTTLPPRDRRGRILCAPGRWAIDTPVEPAFTMVVFDTPRTILLADLCPSTRARLRATKKGTQLRARWPREVCGDLAGKVRLKARTDRDCRTLAGTLSAKGFEHAFTAHAVTCADDVLDPGEVCLGAQPTSQEVGRSGR
jgi:hypothetical protein